jgi:transposase
VKEFLQGLDENLEYISHRDIGGDTVEITCGMKRGKAVCPYCGAVSDKINCRYKRKLKDVSFGEKKVTLVVWFNNYFCLSKDCAHGTFAENAKFAEPFSVRTKRLDKRILELAVCGSGIGTERYIKRNLAMVSDTTVNRIVKKNLMR